MFYSFSKEVLLKVIVLIFVISFLSCVKKINFLTSSVVPAARGYVKVRIDKNNNYYIQIYLSNLAEVKRLVPPKQTYIVWLVNDKDSIKNIGQIISSTKILSKRLTASLETISTLKPVMVFITAEDNIDTQIPSNQVILSTNRF